VALGYFIFGFSMPAMTVGGFFAGVVVLILSTLVTSLTRTKQESSFASFYLISLSFGVLVISSRGTATDLHHVLFGNLLAIDNSLLVLIGTISSLTLLFISVFYRALVLESFDANAFKSYVTQQKFSIVIPWAFLGFLVSNLVSSFHAIGTLLSLGLIVLPAATAFLWARQVQIAMILGLAVSLTACYLGLLISFHFNLASGPAIVLVLGSAYVMSIVYQLFTK
jgi:zinc/manganese transport system permease protein